MKSKSLSFFLVLLIIGVVSAFYAGKYVGDYDAQKKMQTTLDDESNATGTYAFFVLSKALLNLRAGKIVEADTAILRYTKLQIQRVRGCLKSSQCTNTVGALMPDFVDLEKIRLLEEQK
ncbi:MAG: hypothetical protein QM749_16165 [Aquabacterium sp.]